MSEGLSVWVHVDELVAVLTGVPVTEPEKVSDGVKEGVAED